MIPGEPIQLVVLAISVVVSVLGASPFVPGKKHWNALRKKERGQKIPTLPRPQLVDLRVVGRTFGAAIPRVIIVVSVVVIFAVRFVVLVIVADQVVEGEPVMRRD